MDGCPCGSGQSFAACCEPVVKRIKPAGTAEELMRARYSAYATGAVDFILHSTHPDRHEECDRKAVQQWSDSSQWHGLQIVSTSRGGEQDVDGEVEFKVDFTENRMRNSLHETATFKRVDGTWFYYDGEVHAPKPYVRSEGKVNRNDPCPCGSGKKHKKCCF